MRRITCVSLVLVFSLNSFADNPIVLNPRGGCIDPLAPQVTDTCPTLAQISCPEGPCASAIFLSLGCAIVGAPDVWEAVTPGGGGSFANFPDATGIGNASVLVDTKICYTKQHCLCKLNVEGDPVCSTSTLLRQTVIRKWDPIPNVVCHAPE